MAEELESGDPALIWTKNFILLCLANLALFMSMQAILPTLPIYLLHIGAGERDVGYAMSVYTISAMTMRPIAGCLVDSYGRKKVMLLGMGMVVTASLFYKYADTVSFIMALRGFHGMSFGLVSTAIGTIVADSLPSSRISEGMGYFGLTTSLSMSLAPMIGFWLVGRSGYPFLFQAVSLMTMLAFCFSLTVGGTKAPVKAINNLTCSIWERILEKTALIPSGVMFFLAVVYGSVLSFISLFGAELHITNIGLFFTFMALIMLISRPIAGRWADHDGTSKVLLIGHLALFIGMSAIALSHDITGLLFAGSLIGLGMGFTMPTLQALALRYVPAHRRGAATATFFVSFDLGLGLGTMLWGYVAELTGFQTMFFATIIPLTMAGGIYYFFKDTAQDKIMKSKAPTI